MITASQLKPARVLLGFDQRQLAELSRLSAPTIQRMGASEAMVRGNVCSPVKLIAALDLAGVEIIHERAASKAWGGGVRLKSRAEAATGDGGDRPALRSSRAERADK